MKNLTNRLLVLVFSSIIGLLPAAPAFSYNLYEQGSQYDGFYVGGGPGLSVSRKEVQASNQISGDTRVPYNTTSPFVNLMFGGFLGYGLSIQNLYFAAELGTQVWPSQDVWHGETIIGNRVSTELDVSTDFYVDTLFGIHLPGFSNDSLLYFRVGYEQVDLEYILTFQGLPHTSNFNEKNHSVYRFGVGTEFFFLDRLSARLGYVFMLFSKVTNVTDSGVFQKSHPQTHLIKGELVYHFNGFKPYWKR